MESSKADASTSIKIRIGEKNKMSEFINELKERGYIHQCTNESGVSETNPLIGYIGFDCTGKSLHVGSLVQIMMLRKMQQYGHKPIVLMGGGTTQIGDPSGKDEARVMLTKDQIQDNKNELSKVFSKFINFGKSNDSAIMLDNSEWLEGINYIDFLRDYGRYFSVNRMLSFDSVKLRLDREQNLSFLEFNYMLLQAYDFAELYKRYGCRLQMGGSDQWGNIVSGVDLVRRLSMPEVFGLTSPLITTSSGAKMGKTANGAVWLNPDMLSPYDYWQFWRNTEDADVKRFLLLFTELPKDEINRLSALKDKEINEAKIVLANNATALCHGSEAAESAYKTAIETFYDGGSGGELPVYYISKEDISDGIPIFKVLANSGILDSGGAARRMIQGGGVKIENKSIDNEMDIISYETLKGDGIKISIGKKKHCILKVK